MWKGKVRELYYRKAIYITSSSPKRVIYNNVVLEHNNKLKHFIEMYVILFTYNKINLRNLKIKFLLSDVYIPYMILIIDHKKYIALNGNLLTAINDIKNVTRNEKREIKQCILVSYITSSICNTNKIFRIKYNNKTRFISLSIRNNFERYKNVCGNDFINKWGDNTMYGYDKSNILTFLQRFINNTNIDNIPLIIYDISTKLKKYFDMNYEKQIYQYEYILSTISSIISKS